MNNKGYMYGDYANIEGGYCYATIYANPSTIDIQLYYTTCIFTHTEIYSGRSIMFMSLC